MVLWIEPAATRPQGISDAKDNADIAAISENQGDTVEAISMLRGALNADSLRVRSAAIDALQVATHEDASIALVAASADRHPAARALAIDALSELSINVRDALFDTAIRGHDSRAALGAAMHWRTMVANPNSSPMTARLAQAIIDCPHPAPRMSLVPCNQLNARPIAHAITGNSLLLAARQACLMATATEASIDAIPELLAALQHDDSNVRTTTATSIARGHNALSGPAKKTALAALKRAEQTIVPNVAIAVAWAQAALGEPGGYSTLAIYIRAGEGAVRIDALDALDALIPAESRLQRPDLYPALERASSDADTDIRQRVARVAGRLDDGRVLSLLGRLVSDKAPEVRAATALAFARIGRLQTSAPHLISLVTADLDRDVLDAAFVALEHLVHGHPLPTKNRIRSFLSETVDGVRPFFGRDPLRWRRWYQTEGP